MPLYDYKCDRCKLVFEVRQKFNDAQLTVHEGCGGALERLLAVPAFQFKGSGFYITDYNGKNASKGGSDSKSSESKSESKPESKSESKSESKPASSDSSKK